MRFAVARTQTVEEGPERLTRVFALAKFSSVHFLFHFLFLGLGQGLNNHFHACIHAFHQITLNDHTFRR